MKHSHSYYQQNTSRGRSSYLQMIWKYSERFCNIHRKTPVLESLFNNVTGLKVHNFIRKGLHHMCFLAKNIAKFLENTFSAFKEHFLKMSYWTPQFFLLMFMNFSNFSALRSISQYGYRWAIHLHYISMTSWQGKNL